MVTNDDGITSEGLQTLVRHLARTEHDVVVIAPDSDWSGAGASLQGWDAIADVRSELVTIDGAPGVEAWAVSGSPALTVMLGRLGAFGPAPDLIVSGINAGANTGNSILHSGTVGAALTAQNFGGSGLAVSVAATSGNEWVPPGTDVTWFWDSAAELAVELLPLVVEAPERTVLNLNVPARPRNEIEVRWARLATFGQTRAAIQRGDDGRLNFDVEADEPEFAPDSDKTLLRAGFATITSLVGLAEAWSEHPPAVERDAAAGTPHLHTRIVPGASLHEVHRIPDASRSLRSAFLVDTPAVAGDPSADPS